MAMKINVVPYRPEWPTLFQGEKEKLSQVINEDNLINILHIGSTSVPGLSAKPVIDMLVVVKDINQLDQDNNQIASLGYLPMGEFGIPGRRYFRKGEDNRTHQIHAFQYDNMYDISRHCLVRDYLRCHEEARKAYANIKIEGAEKYPESIDDYGDYKDAFVKQLEKDALMWHWTNN